MPTITKHVSLDDLPKALGSFFDQVPFATAQALNQTAFDLMRIAKRHIQQNWERNFKKAMIRAAKTAR